MLGQRDAGTKKCHLRASHEAFVRLLSEGGAGRGRSTALHYGYGRGIGVGRGRGVGVTRGPAVAVAVTVAVGVAVAVGVNVAVAVGVGAGKQKNSIELSGVPSLPYPPANHMKHETSPSTAKLRRGVKKLPNVPQPR